MGRLRYLLVAAVILFAAGACSRSTELPRGIRGVMHVDESTDYVLRYSPSSIGGSCDGWNAISIERPGETSEEMVNLLCWKEIDGFIATSTMRVGNAARFPVAMVNQEKPRAEQKARGYMPPIR